MRQKTYNHGFKISYTFVCKKVPGKITDKYTENLTQASGEI